MLVITAHIYPQKEHYHDLLAALRSLVEPSRAEEGCNFYSIGVEDEEQGVLMIFEGWRDMEALQQHLALPHVAKLLQDFDGKYTNKVLLHTVSETQNLTLD